MNRNKGSEARPLLAAVYSWFTDCCDMPDLNDANTLLTQLGCRPQTGKSPGKSS
jgi:hypothetical protein